MLRIKYLDLKSREIVEENFASYEVFEMLEEMLPDGCAILSYSEYDEEGNNIGGADGCNAGAILHCIKRGNIAEIESQMYANYD